MRGAIYLLSRAFIWCEARGQRYQNNNNNNNNNNNDNNNNIADIELGHLSTRSGLTLPEASVTPLVPSAFWFVVFMLSSVICFNAFCVYVTNSFFCMPVFCPKAIYEYCRRRNKNLSIAWIDYQKAFDSVPHSWVEKSIELVGVNSKIVRFFELSMEKWNTRLFF